MQLSRSSFSTSVPSLPGADNMTGYRYTVFEFLFNFARHSVAGVFGMILGGENGGRIERPI